MRKRTRIAEPVHTPAPAYLPEPEHMHGVLIHAPLSELYPATAHYNPPPSGAVGVGLSMPAWTPDDGPMPYVFDRKPAGQRCTWTARNVTGRNGVIEPERMLPLAEMVPAQMRAELEDLAARVNAKYQKGAAEILSRWDELERFDYGEAKLFIADARRSYPEVISEWDIPGNTKYWRWRKGWIPAGFGAGGQVVSF